jgi:hypothetical protein
VPKEGFEERALAVGLATQGHNICDRQLLPEGRLEMVVGLEPRKSIGDGVWVGLVGGGLGGRAEKGIGGRHWREGERGGTTDGEHFSLF